MVITVNLTDLAAERNQLLAIVTRKIAASKSTTLNEEFDSNLKITLPAITGLLNAIESKIHHAEILYYSYFENVDHAVLCGSSATLPISMQATFLYGTALIKNEISIDDKAIYKEIIDMEFQNFILTTASLFENIVRLAEILVKKVIVHQLGDRFRPISSTLFHYKNIFDSLLKLGYRRTDIISRCLLTHTPFMTKYLVTINNLRNSFIHGFANNLADDGYNYKVARYETTAFSATTPELNIDEFTKNIITESRQFYKDMLVAISAHIKPSGKSIPC